MPRVLTLALCLALVASVALADEADRNRSADPGFEVLLDSGLVLPLGNLGAGLPHSPNGLGAEQGYRAGLRCRYISEGGFTLSPTFSFCEFGDYDGLYDESGKTGGWNQKYKVQASVIRYGLDLGYITPGQSDQWRALVAGGLALMNNRYREELVDDEFVYTASVYSLSWMLSVGTRRGPLEVAMEYHGSSFETDQFFLEALDNDYNWSHLVLRVGWMLPRL